MARERRAKLGAKRRLEQRAAPAGQRMFACLGRAPQGWVGSVGSGSRSLATLESSGVVGSAAFHAPNLGRAKAEAFDAENRMHAEHSLIGNGSIGIRNPGIEGILGTMALPCRLYVRLVPRGECNGEATHWTCRCAWTCPCNSGTRYSCAT